jgi:hypothetical protein
LRAPLHEGLIAKIAPAQLQQVEGINAHGHVPPVQECKEVGFAVGSSRDQLAVDDTGPSR